MVGGRWLVNNTVQNLAALGKDISFGFLGPRRLRHPPALIPYTTDSTHGRASLVGILNTLLVAALGCVARHGDRHLIAGVLRLSNNWIVARLAAVYVEFFRNIPLLL